jgi:hypothetical protein
MQTKEPFPVVQLAGRGVGMDPSQADWWWKLFIVGLIASGGLVLLLERRHVRKLKAEAFMEHWRERREHRDSGQQRT